MVSIWPLLSWLELAVDGLLKADDNSHIHMDKISLTIVPGINTLLTTYMTINELGDLRKVTKR